MSRRLDDEDQRFYAAAASSYRARDQTSPTHVRVLDASRPREGVLTDALAAIADLIV